MLPRVLPIVSLAILLTACKPPEQTAVISIVGAVLIDGAGGPPISNSVVTIENGRIRAAGSRVNLLVPPEAAKIDGAGKFIVPAVVDVLHPREASTPPYVIVKPSDPDSVIEQAARGRIPRLGDVFSLADARILADRGVTGLLHMIRDTETIDPAFIARLRDLGIVAVPNLAGEHDAALLDRAKRNTRLLASGGVMIALGSPGDPQREMELLLAAGLSPAEVLIAASRNSAIALNEADRRGTLEPGKRADLLILNANPADDIRNMQKIDRVMQEGQWR